MWPRLRPISALALRSLQPAERGCRGSGHLWRFSRSFSSPNVELASGGELENEDDPHLHPPQSTQDWDALAKQLGEAQSLSASLEGFLEDDAHLDKNSGQAVEAPVQLFEGLESPWPYLSEVDERLSTISAGPHWPWKSNMSERLEAVRVEFTAPANYTETVLPVQTDLDLAAVARVASKASTDQMRLLFQQYLEGQSKVVDHRFECASLVSILASICQMQSRCQLLEDTEDLELQLSQWHEALVTQLLQRPLRPRDALVLLASMRWCNDAFRGDAATKILEVTTEVLQSEDDEAAPSASELLLALEALSLLRQGQPGLEASCRELANRLLALLGCGPTLVQLLLSMRSEHRKAQALRLLASLALLPEALAQPGGRSSSPCGAICVARLSGVRYGRDAVVEQETAASWWSLGWKSWRWQNAVIFADLSHAAAAFTLSRCGAWTSGSGNYLLMQALRRDMEAIEAGGEDPRPRQVFDAERISSTAGAAQGELFKANGSWWLAAVAMSNLQLEVAAGTPEDWAQRAPEALFAAISEAEGAAPAARSLWALHVLGKASEKEELAKQFFQDLDTMDVSSFTWDTWQLLRELQPLLAEEKEDAAEPEIFIDFGGHFSVESPNLKCSQVWCGDGNNRDWTRDRTPICVADLRGFK
eukprot:s153_g49.t1